MTIISVIFFKHNTIKSNKRKFLKQVAYMIAYYSVRDNRGEFVEMNH